MARPLKPFIRGGGYYPSNKWTPLVYNGGYTTMDGGEEPEPPTPVYWKTITGVSPLVLAGAMQEHIRSLKQYGKCEQRNLPHGYTELDYIEGDGTAYIDLGFKLTQDDDIEVDFALTTSQASKYIFGNRGGDASVNNIALFFASTANKVVVDFNNSDYSLYRAGPSDALTTGVKYSAVLNKNKRGIYNGATTIVENTTVCADTIETAGNAAIFGGFYQNGAIYTANNFKGRIYRVTIAGKHDLRPAKNSSDVVGMYDLVTGQFFTNAGTGSFTAGADAVPTPAASMDIVTNNGALRYSANMANVNAQTALTGYYISAQGVVTADTNNWLYQAFIPCKPNTTYTLSMSSSVYYVTISEYSTAADSGFVVRKNGSAGANTSLTITTGATTNYIRFGANLDRAVVTLERVLSINWMLNDGSTAIPYAPYVDGGIYTDGTPEALTVSGINLLDPSTSNITIGQQVTANGDITSAYPNNWRTDYIPVVGGKTYAFWGRAKADNTISAYNRINWYTANKTHIYPRPSYTVDTVTVGTAPSNAAFAMLSCSCFKSDAAITREQFDLFNWMFSETAQEIPYQPYTVQTVNDVPMLFGVGDYKDTAEIIGGIKTGKVGVMVLDGTENFYVSTGDTYGVAIDKNKYPGSYVDAVPVLCTHLPFSTSSSTSQTDVICNRSGNYGIRLLLNETIMALADTKVAAAKVFFASEYAKGTPVMVIYVKATETAEQTTAHALHSYNGTTIVDAQTNVDPVTLSVEYASSEE